MSAAGADNPYGRARMVITRGRTVESLDARVVTATPARLEVQLDGPGGPFPLADEEVFLALYGGPLGCILTPAIVTRLSPGLGVQLRLPEEGLKVQGRAYFRVPVVRDVAVQDVTAGPWRRLRTINLSAGGVLIADPVPAVPGAMRRLRIALPGGAYQLDARVVRCDAAGVAYRFEAVTDQQRSCLVREVMALERGARTSR